MQEVFQVEARGTRGSRNARRLRSSGFVPAILYGHGQEPVSLSVPLDAVRAAVRHGSRIVDLNGAVKDKAFIREVQWNTFGTRILHLDLTRVSETDRVRVSVKIELKGESPGAKAGAILTQFVHEAPIECLATAIPDRLVLSVAALDVGGSISLGNVPLPEGTKLVGDPTAVVVHCELPKDEAQLPASPTEGAEPEVIGRKAGAGEEEEE